MPVRKLSRIKILTAFDLSGHVKGRLTVRVDLNQSDAEQLARFDAAAACARRQLCETLRGARAGTEVFDRELPDAGQTVVLTPVRLGQSGWKITADGEPFVDVTELAAFVPAAEVARQAMALDPGITPAGLKSALRNVNAPFLEAVVAEAEALVAERASAG